MDAANSADHTNTNNGPAPTPGPNGTITLFVADVGIPLEKEDEFINLFQNTSGFIGGRLRRDRNDNVVGFAEYEDLESAVLAKNRLQGYRLASSHSEQGLAIQFSHGGRNRRSRRDDYGNRRGRRSGPQRDRHAGAGGLPLMVHDVAQLYTPHAMSATPFGAYVPQSFQNALPYHQALPPDASSTLYVEGLPLDATEREVAHIFRPWAGYQLLRVLPKESKQYPNRTYNLCFVEFDNKYQATVAMNAVQGYKMDIRDAKGLKISYAKTERKERRKPAVLGNSVANSGSSTGLPSGDDLSPQSDD